MIITPTDDPTLAYYEDQAESFFAETVDVDMAPLYARFLPHAQSGAHSLETGFGSGRDDPAIRRDDLRRFDFPSRDSWRMGLAMFKSVTVDQKSALNQRFHHRIG